MAMRRTLGPFWLFPLIGLFVLASNKVLVMTHGWVRLGVGLLAYGLLFGLIYLAGLSLRELGLARANMRKGMVLGLRVAAVIIAGLLIAFLVSPDIFQDDRYRQGIWIAVCMALVIIPLQTVLFEELLFRGLLWGYINKQYGSRWATHGSSAVFGLWHIAPSLGMNAAAISVGALSVGRALLVGIIVVVTYSAGLFLCELRRRSGSLLAPIIVHWSINGTATILAALAWSKI
ncbi:MAG: type II CAAX endopeptidase family protein [Candidatus Saccharimonadales bacterium]